MYNDCSIAMILGQQTIPVNAFDRVQYKYILHYIITGGFITQLLAIWCIKECVVKLQAHRAYGNCN